MVQPKARDILRMLFRDGFEILPLGYFFDRFIGDAGIVGQNFKGPVVGGELAGYSGHYTFSEIWTVVFRIVVIHIISSMNVRVFCEEQAFERMISLYVIVIAFFL